jgi:hypothetical protein
MNLGKAKQANLDAAKIKMGGAGYGQNQDGIEELQSNEIQASQVPDRPKKKYADVIDQGLNDDI